MLCSSRLEGFKSAKGDNLMREVTFYNVFLSGNIVTRNS